MKIIDKVNEGVSIARNVGIFSALGSYVVLLDADDILHSEYLEEIKHLIDEFKICKIFATNYSITTNSHVSEMSFNRFIVDNYFELAMYMPFLTSSSIVINKLCFDEEMKFNSSYTHGEDLDMWARLIIKYKYIGYSERKLVSYIHSSNNRSFLKLPEPQKHFAYHFDFNDKNLQDQYGLAVTTFSLGSNYCSRKQYEKGLGYMNDALEKAKAIGAKELLKGGYEAIALVYAEQKNFSKAYEYQKLLMQIKDSILNSETAKQINELQTKYESEKQQKEIELITKNNQIQALELNKNKLWMWVLLATVLLVLSLASLLYNRYQIKQKANLLLEHRNSEITLQKKEITDSINYAKRIQESILPPKEHWKKMLPESFIFYRPKDIVSGDFYWIEQKNEVVCFAAVDCTGHGVPGALMSVVGFNLLTQAVNEMHLTQPSEILKHLDAGVTKTLRQSVEGKGVKDGMDLSLCSLNKVTNELQYAGAFNSLYYIKNGEFKEIKSDKFPIGVNLDGVVDNYNNHSIQLQKGDSVYLFSDGYADQFGGPKGKKFKYNQLKNLLISISDKSIDEQQKLVANAFDSWKGNLEQVDDVLIIGVRV